MIGQFPLLFLQACLTSIVTGSAAWCLLKIATRVWPGMAAQRAPWLLAKLAAAAVLILVLLPGASHFRIFPTVELDAPSSIHTGAGDQSSSNGFDDIDLGVEQPARTLNWLGDAWLGLYLIGVLYAGARCWRDQRALRALMAASHRLLPAELSRHPAFAIHDGKLPAVLEIDAPISPMLAGLVRPVLLLPQHLRDLDIVQQQMVIEHELTHLSRLDQLWLHVGIGLQVLLWFNPALPALRRQLAWAQELGCDREVLADRTLQQRKSYAAALLAQFTMQQTGPKYAAMPFGAQARESATARVMLIRDGVPLHSRAVVRAASCCMLMALLLASVVLQPAFALRTDNASTWPATAASAAPPQWHAPLQRMRITSYFGTVRISGAKPHGGIDLSARSGTPITAPASGTVVASTSLYEGEAKYGEVIAIEHADGLRSVYAHLQQRGVKVGDVVTAGQIIGRTGATGRVTGPHLHLEIHRNGVTLDPELLLGSLDGTDHAKQARDTQRSR